MTKIFRTAAAGVALFAAVGMGTAAHAQVTESADARAEILQALQLTNDADLNFGTLILNNTSTGGTVDVDSSGVRVCNGDVICGPGATEAAALFTVSGAVGSTVAISLEDVATNGVTLRHTGFTASANAEHNIDLVDLVDSQGVYNNFSGSEQFGVGGRISLDGSEVAGEYVGEFDVTVEYQ